MHKLLLYYCTHERHKKYKVIHERPLSPLYTHTHAESHTHVHTRTVGHTRTHTHIHIHTHAHTHAHTHTHAHKHTQHLTCTHIFTYMQTLYEHTHIITCTMLLVLLLIATARYFNFYI